jgi:CheY-like chemotaxis protein
VTNSEKMLRRVLGEDITLEVRLAPGLWHVRCDVGQLEQVIMNLCVNARDAMRGGGRLVVETRNGPPAQPLTRDEQADPEGWVRLIVSDTGTGLSDEAKAHLFEPFFTTKEKGLGTGLGLATVYGIVTQSGGHIGVESRAGSTRFEISLPRTSAPGVAEAGHSQAGARGSEVVLVVEDDDAVRGVTVRSLRAAGYEVIVAASGSEAMALGVAALARVRLLVTDVVMPGMSGPVVASELCRRHPALRVLYVSGHPEETLTRALRSKDGALSPGVELLNKPFTAPQLLQRVRHVLDA